jgi:hypothetical protein
MAKQLINCTTNGEFEIGSIQRRPDALSWFGTMFASGVYGGATINWQWQHAVPSDTSGFFPLKDLSGVVVTSSSASGNDSFNSQFGTGKNNFDRVQLWVNITNSTTNTNLNLGFYDNQ